MQQMNHALTERQDDKAHTRTGATPRFGAMHDKLKGLDLAAQQELLSPKAEHAVPVTIYAVGRTDTTNLKPETRRSVGLESAMYQLELSVSAIDALGGKSFDDAAFKSATNLRRLGDVDPDMDTFNGQVEHGTTGPLSMVRAGALVGARERKVKITASNNGMYALMRMIRGAKDSMNALPSGAAVQMAGYVTIGGKKENAESRQQRGILFTQADNFNAVVTTSVAETTAAAYAACGMGASIPDRYAGPWADLGNLERKDRGKLASAGPHFSAIASTLQTRLGEIWTKAPNAYTTKAPPVAKAFASALSEATLSGAPSTEAIQGFLNTLRTMVVMGLDLSDVPEELQDAVRKKVAKLVATAFSKYSASWFVDMWGKKHGDARKRQLKEQQKDHRVNNKSGEISD